MVLWSVDTDDYRQPGVEAIVQRALEGAKPGAIILMHDAGGDRSQTIAALPRSSTGCARAATSSSRSRSCWPTTRRRAASRCRRTSAATDARERPPALPRLSAAAHVSQAPWITISCSETRSGRRSLSAADRALEPVVGERLQAAAAVADEVMVMARAVARPARSGPCPARPRRAARSPISSSSSITR